MRERERYSLATMTAEAMCNLWEMQSQREEPDLDAMIRRLKDLSAYSLTHAEIMDQREGVELLALARFFGATSDPSLHKNQVRLQSLSSEALAYPGRAEVIEEEIKQRAGRQTKSGHEEEEDDGRQPRLL